MKLRLPLALLVAWALACGGGEEDVITTPPPPEPPVEVTPPVPPPPPTGTTDGTTPPTGTTDGTTPPTGTTDGTTPPTGTTDGTATADGTTEEGPVEVKEEGETKVETRSLRTSARAPARQRQTLDEIARRQLEKRATDLGYTKITNFKMGDVRCNDTDCTGSATATATRTVTVKKDGQ